MPVQIDRLDTTVEITRPRPDTIAPATMSPSPGAATNPPQQTRETVLQSVADGFAQFLRAHGI